MDNGAIHRPGVELAERVARFETPFEYLKTARGGFAPARRFLLDKTLAGESDALATRDHVMRVMRSRRLGEPLPADTRDLEREYMAAHEDDYQAFRQVWYPWIGTPPQEPHPDVDALLDSYICNGLKDYGFDRKNRSARKTYWRCHSSILPRRITIEFDKGTRLPGTTASGSVAVGDLGYSVALGDPFFYSNAFFYTSRADDPAAQMKVFFDEYHRIFPHVIDALSKGIAAAAA
jgi:hypothetical protein